jgi:hypothetical protein
MELRQGRGQFLTWAGMAADFTHLERSQLAQGAALRCSIPPTNRGRSRAHPIDRTLPARRQLEVAALLEFNQQGATGHVFELAGGVAPVPRFTQDLR